jgi:hypothetical protein
MITTTLGYKLVPNAKYLDQHKLFMMPVLLEYQLHSRFMDFCTTIIRIQIRGYLDGIGLVSNIRFLAYKAAQNLSQI